MPGWLSVPIEDDLTDNTLADVDAHWQDIVE